MNAIKTWAAAAAMLVSAPAFAGLMTPPKDTDGGGDRRHVTLKSGADDSNGSVIGALLSGPQQGGSRWEGAEREGTERKGPRREESGRADARREGDSDSKRKPGRSDHDDHVHPGALGDAKKGDKDKQERDAKPEHQHVVPPFNGPAAEEPSDGDEPWVTVQPLNVETAPEVVSRVDEPATLGLLGLAGLAALATRRRLAGAQRA